MSAAVSLVPVSPPAPVFNLDPWPAYPLPDHVPVGAFSEIAGPFKTAIGTIERATVNGGVRPGWEDHMHNVVPRLHAATRRVLVGLHPDVEAARKALQAVGNDKHSEAYAEARTKLDDTVAVVSADITKSLDGWRQACLDKLRSDYEEKQAKRGADALTAVAILTEVVPKVAEAVAALESVRAQYVGALLALAKVHPSIGRFDPRHTAGQFNVALEALKCAPPLADIRKRLYPAEGPPKAKGPRKPKRGEAFEHDAASTAEGVAV